MCNEYALKKEWETLLEDFVRFQLPPFQWIDAQTRSGIESADSIKVRDAAAVVRLNGEKLVGATMPWGWLAPGKKPVFNFRSAVRDFSNADRVLVPATAFYEYTVSPNPNVRIKIRHMFTMRKRDWFWMAGIVKDGCFSILTVAAGPDVSAYDDREVVTLRPEDGLHWLTLDIPTGAILRSSAPATFRVQLLRRGGEPKARNGENSFSLENIV